MQITLAERDQQRKQVLLYNPPAARCGEKPLDAGATIEFGRFRLLLRRRELLADGAPVRLGTRAFDILMVLIEAEGSLVTRDQTMERVWPGIVVAPENLKVQISELRRALGNDRDLIRTEFGRGYRFTGAVRRSTISATDSRSPLEAAHSGIEPNGASPTDFTAIADRLTALEVTLAETLGLLAGNSRRSVREIRRYRPSAELPARRGRLHRRVHARSRRMSGRANWPIGSSEADREPSKWRTAEVRTATNAATSEIDAA